MFRQYGTTIDGQTPTGAGAWTTAQIPGGPTGDTSPMAQQAFFRGFFTSDGIYALRWNSLYEYTVGHASALHADCIRHPAYDMGGE